MDHRRLRHHHRGRDRSVERSTGDAPVESRAHRGSCRTISRRGEEIVKHSIVGGILLVAAAFANGCGGGGKAGSGAKPDSSTQAAKQGPKYKIAMIAKSSSNPVFLASRTGAEAAAKDLSAQHKIDIEIIW